MELIAKIEILSFSSAETGVPGEKPAQQSSEQTTVA